MINANRADKVEELEEVSLKLLQTNVVGNIHLFNLFLPLVMKGKVKKVITISSGQADLDLINELEIETSALYSASKAAMNVIVAKFSAQYKKDGVLFMSMSPGAVEVGHYDNSTYSLVTIETSRYFTNVYPQPPRNRCRAWQDLWASLQNMRLTSRAQPQWTKPSGT